MRSILIPLVLVLTSLVSCFFDTPPPGYSGPVPSARGQAVLQELEGQVLTDGTGAFGGGDWTIGPFGVIPNPVSGKGPVVLLEQDGETRYLPVETQGDVADLYRRVTGRTSPLVKGGTSERYLKAFGGH
ncbi:MAG: hypothetical protein V2A76_07250 [Planctomycetota bacterium]